MLSLSHILHAYKHFAILSTLCILLQYCHLLIVTNECSNHHLLVCGFADSSLGWFLVLIMDIDKKYIWHFTGAFLFSIGYIGAFPVAIMCSQSTQVWFLYGVAVVSVMAFAVLFIKGHMTQAYICEWVSFFFFGLSLVAIKF